MDDNEKIIVKIGGAKEKKNIVNNAKKEETDKFTLEKDKINDPEYLLSLDYSDAEILDFIHSALYVYLESDDFSELKNRNIEIVSKYSIAYKCYRLSQASYKRYASLYELRYRANSKRLLSNTKVGAQKIEMEAKNEAAEVYGDELYSWELRYRFWQAVIEELDKVSKRIDSIAMLIGIERKIYKVGLGDMGQK